MNTISVRLPEWIEKKIRVKAEVEHRKMSEQIKKYIIDGILTEENPDLPLSFIKETIEAKREIEEGLGVEYKFGIID